MLTKVTSILTLIVVLIGFCSGCTLLPWFEETEFVLDSSAIIDDEGFPTLLVNFTVTGKITLKLLGPNRNVVFSEEFYKGMYEKGIVLDEYQKTPTSGTYILKALDEHDDKVFENELFFSNQNTSILDIDQNWWVSDKATYCVGLTVTLRNSGGLPVYPWTATVLIGTNEVSAKILPSVILPDQTVTVFCIPSLEEVDDDSAKVEFSLFNSDEDLLATATRPLDFSSNVIDLDYSWRYQGSYRSFVLPDIDFLYDYYSSLNRLDTQDYAAYIFDSYDEFYLDFVAEQLLSLTDASDSVDIINFIASFVQSLEYALDDEDDQTCEYPRYPVEMLTDKKGDCEDKAILTASLLDTLEYNVSLIRVPNHMAVGVHLEENISEYDYYVEEYYFLETTRYQSPIGRVPDKYQGLTNITAYPLTPRPILLHNWKNATRLSSSEGTDYVTLKIMLENIGGATAYQFEVTGGFFDTTAIVYNMEAITVPFLAAHEKKIVELRLDVPQGFSTTLQTQIYVDDELVEEKKSATVFP